MSFTKGGAKELIQVLSAGATAISTLVGIRIASALPKEGAGDWDWKLGYALGALSANWLDAALLFAFAAMIGAMLILMFGRLLFWAFKR